MEYMTDFLKRTWAEVNLDHIAHNIDTVRSLVNPNAQIMGVVKADGYGHGDVFAARILERQGIHWFGVSNIEEAISLRSGGIGGDILILGATPPDMAPQLHEYRLTQTVYSLDFAKALSMEAVTREITIPCHIKLDTGMGRLGLTLHHLDGAVREAEQIFRLPGLTFTGIFTHFSVADEPVPDSRAYTLDQFDRYMECCRRLEAGGYRLGLKHCCNSAATLCYPQMHLDMVRPGIILYGLLPSLSLLGRADLRPAMTLKTAVSMVKPLEKGDFVSYGRTYKAPGPVQVATVPLGYADGYFRQFSNRAHMLIGNHAAPVIGRVCMDQSMLDVTGRDVRVGDEVVVFGADGLTADDLAVHADTIGYELVCDIGKRVSRIYFQDGKRVAVTRYKDMEY